jgi:hypothetical protein
MRDQLLCVEPREMLNHFPECYFVGDYDMPPSRPLMGHVEVSVKGKLAFDLRNLSTLSDWEWSQENDLPTNLGHDLFILDVEGKPKIVTFWFRGRRHTVFHLFYEETIH